MDKVIKVKTLIDAVDKLCGDDNHVFVYIILQLAEGIPGLTVKELEEILAEEYTKQSTDEIYESGGYDNEQSDKE